MNNETNSQYFLVLKSDFNSFYFVGKRIEIIVKIKSVKHYKLCFTLW